MEACPVDFDLDRVGTEEVASRVEVLSLATYGRRVDVGSDDADPVNTSIRDVAVYIWRKLIDADPWPDEVPIPVLSDP